jgi:hypothetical protein
MKAVLTFLLLLGLRAPLAADLQIKETSTDSAAGSGSRVTSIKGLQMRIDTTLPAASGSTIFDLPGGVTIRPEPDKRRAEVRDIAVRGAALEREYPRTRTTVALAPTGASREIAGASCAEHAFTIRVPLSKDGELALLMTGSAWIAASAPGADDYAAFARAAVDRDLVLGPASDNRILLAVARGQTELYRALAGVRGIPFLIDTKSDVDGHGVLAGMVAKVVRGSRTTTVTSVSVAPLADTLFSIPDGWTRDRK